MRVDKYLSEAAVASRSESAKAIRSGQVLVNGKVCKSPSEHIDEETARVIYKGALVNWQKFTYVMLNKPTGTISSTDNDDRAVMKILPKEFTKMNMFPCGRLDIDTVGLLLITNDGELGHELLSPKHHVTKSYEYICSPGISENQKVQIEKGVNIGDYITKEAKLELIDSEHGTIYITEGKFHQVKRMFESVGSKIVFLKRLTFGSLKLDESLSEGQWRYLTDDEINSLRECANRKNIDVKWDFVMEINEIISQELGIKLTQVDAAVKLLDEGNTVPFISRYRKEVTGGLDDEQLRNLTERLTYLRNLQKRREEVISLIEGQGKLTPELVDAINAAVTVTEVDDIYRPFRPKRKTRASIAREKGLEPLATLIFAQQDEYEKPIEELAKDYIDEEKGVKTAEEAIAGAKDIIAEDVSDNADYRKGIRTLTFEHGIIVSKKTDNENNVYEQYYDYSEKVSTIPSHRVLAINRGENEEILKVSIEVNMDIVLNYLFDCVITNFKSPAYKYVASAVCDSYDRLIAPSIEREIRNDITDVASESAIKLFSDNLKHLLMAAPLKGKTVLGYDPGYRTGCKLAVVDKTGRVIDTAVIYPTKPHEKIEESKKVVKSLVNRYGVDVVSIGNGTASAESEMFIADTLREIDRDTKYIIVSEAGASVYSASKQGAEEFPDFDVTQRSAVSIARRLQDPLAELVKIDPKSIGVGQYQHDMKEARLDEALTGVVEDCVNSVGVDANTASYSLLSYISGINLASAKSMVKYREENGEFESRAEIKKVPKIGAKAYEQCAGFLRIPGSKEILDNTAVHPESYEVAKALLDKFGFGEDDVRNNNLGMLRSKVTLYGFEKLADELGCGVPTLQDIISELEKPGRDIRDSLPQPQLREKVIELEDLVPGQVMTGTVRNVIDFGAFVDIGVHQDGLLHISEISEKYIKHPSEVLSVGDIIQVKIKNVDLNKKRIGLTRKGL